MLTLEGCMFYDYSGSNGIVLIFDGISAKCGACEEVVYPEVSIIRNHDFYRFPETALWIAHDLQCTIHACGEAVEVQDAQIAALLAEDAALGSLV